MDDGFTLKYIFFCSIPESAMHLSDAQVYTVPIGFSTSNLMATNCCRYNDSTEVQTIIACNSIAIQDTNILATLTNIHSRYVVFSHKECLKKAQLATRSAANNAVH